MTDPTAFHILHQLVRKGIFGLDDLEEIARRLDKEDEQDSAHAVRACYFEANGTTEAELRRSEMRVVHIAPRLKLGPDGGNAE